MKHLNWMFGLGLLGLATTAAAAGREPGARLQALDSDGNGLLSGRELRPPRAGRPGNRQRGGPGAADTRQSTH